MSDELNLDIVEETETTETPAADPAPAPNPTLVHVKKAINIGGTYQDDTILEWIAEVKAYLAGAGVSEANMTNGLIARGVVDLWNYGSGDGDFSGYFKTRAIQAALRSK